MRFCIEKEVFELFPNFCRGIVRASDIDNSGTCSEIETLLGEQADRVCRDAGIDPATHPRLMIWKEAYRKFGSNPNKFTPSILFLAKQAKKGKPIRSISPAVDAFNVISLKYLIPCGGDDLDTVQDDVTLGIAVSDETFAPIFSPDAVEYPDAGEVIYVNRLTKKVLCRRWNWRNADFSKINPETKNIAVNVDGMMPSISRSEIEAAAEDLRELLLKGCGGTVSIHYLDAQNPVLAL
jgi:DNA/RNA-binding domain of Phe-tRNA-synthetase-like protein